MPWRRLFPLEELTTGQSRMVCIDDDPIAICRIGEREVYAIEDRCSHDGAPLGGSALTGAVLECPRHGARFDVRDGRVLRMPAAAPLDTFSLRISAAGDVEIDWEEA